VGKVFSREYKDYYNGKADPRFQWHLICTKDKPLSSRLAQEAQEVASHVDVVLRHSSVATWDFSKNGRLLSINFASTQDCIFRPFSSMNTSLRFVKLWSSATLSMKQFPFGEMFPQLASLHLVSNNLVDVLATGMMPKLEYLRLQGLTGGTAILDGPSLQLKELELTDCTGIVEAPLRAVGKLMLAGKSFGNAHLVPMIKSMPHLHFDVAKIKDIPTLTNMLAGRGDASSSVLQSYQGLPVLNLLQCCASVLKVLYDRKVTEFQIRWIPGGLKKGATFNIADATYGGTPCASM